MALVSDILIATTEEGNQMAECPKCLGVYDDSSEVNFVVEYGKCFSCLQLSTGYAF